MKTTLNKCPKGFKKYKKWITKGMQAKYPDMENVSEMLGDELIKTSIAASPFACAEFFDSVDLIGTYTQFGDKFVINVNNVVIEDKTNKEKETVLLGSADRRETEEILIKYLFLELEKTL
jgi:hypothetical protein